jgi:molybdopterin-binding protein
VKLSARDILKGKVKRINHGAVNSEIIVELSGGLEMVSVITKTATEKLQLAEGKGVYAIVKASNLMLGVD